MYIKNMLVFVFLRHVCPLLSKTDILFKSVMNISYSLAKKCSYDSLQFPDKMKSMQ